jgi:hypothetical protein
VAQRTYAAAAGVSLSSLTAYPRRGTEVRFLDGEGLLFDSTSQKLYAANRAATFVWCCLEDGMAAGEIVRAMHRTLRLSVTTAQDYVETAVREWRRHGLLTDSIERPAPPPRVTETPVHRRLQATGDSIHGESFDPVAERHCRLLDTDFRIRFGSEDARIDLDPYLRPLAGEPAGAAPITVDVIERSGLHALVHEGRVIERWADPEELVPIVKLALLGMSLRLSGDFGALHAAAVCRETGPCVLLPGPSGVGKSTLAAGLLSEGFRSLGDDTVVLADGSLDIRAVPFGICLKDGSWKLLASRFPDLSRQPIHDRLDGKRVRYLIPPPSARPDSPRAAAWIAFPRRTNRRSELVPISRPDALCRLAVQFCPLGSGLDLPKVEQLIEWIGGLSCFELRYATLDHGINLIKSLFK